MTFDTDYQSGQIAFERGEYRQAVSCFLAALAQVQPNTKIGGEVQVWLATAYEATGQIPEAKALCLQLSNHPNLDTRQASKRMLYIMQAPELTRRDEWLIKIPDLSQIEDAEGKAPVSIVPILPPTAKAKVKSIDEIYAPVDLSQVNTKDNGFIPNSAGRKRKSCIFKQWEILKRQISEYRILTTAGSLLEFVTKWDWLNKLTND